MHLLMTALGSYGDVYPIVGLGAAMRERGHQVSIITNPHFQSVVESAGVEHVPIGSLQDYQEMPENKNIWHPIRGPLIVIRRGIVGLLRDLYAVIESNYRPGETVLAAHALDISSRLMQETVGAPLANVFFSPLMFRSDYQSPRMGPMLLQKWVPRWLRRAQFWFADHLVIDRLICPELNRFRRELGLAPVSGVMRDWWFSPQLVLGLFPDWFAPPQPDWPSQVRLAGFPLWDQAAPSGLPKEVREFLSEGDPPIVFTPGSSMAHGKAFFQAAVQACQLLGRRGALLTKYPRQLPSELPDSVRHFEFVPFSQLLPQAAAVVHHGGIGSSAQGLAAGTPQVIMPMAYDQPDNSQRLRRLGVAEELKPRKFRGPALAQTLDRLISNPSPHEQCRHWAERCDAAQALAASCEALEKLAETSLAARRQPSARLSPRG